MADDEKNVKLLSSDDRTFDVSMSVARMSVTIKNLIDGEYAQSGRLFWAGACRLALHKKRSHLMLLCRYLR